MITALKAKETPGPGLEELMKDYPTLALIE